MILNLYPRFPAKLSQVLRGKCDFDVVNNKGGKIRFFLNMEEKKVK